ncbi:hypothetical protein [Spirosoma utsteinense]|uniref:CheY-like chemotaxis protein n=1 Tax=Spirosoma utsteinense TaxID=2585773 RepID=A0ABR6WA75_9BACT|nr:hypothetical protein [Spirosoma utsteinense]MBC3787182.1 CheY-like chemotaxis protein [Spirosoma utsteinense]MBC3792866.1 CheY-like chemotaxis protein [Spirosoma utsteinense]
MSQRNHSDWLLLVDHQSGSEMTLVEAIQQLSPTVHTVRVNSVPMALSLLQTCQTREQPLPRLILANLQLPQREDGFHLLAALTRAASGFGRLPLVISSPADDRDRQEVNQRGGTYLPKPVSPDEWNDFLKTIHYYWQKSKV